MPASTLTVANRLLVLFTIAACGGSAAPSSGQDGGGDGGGGGEGGGGGGCPSIIGTDPGPQGCPAGDRLCMGLDGNPGNCCVPAGENPPGYYCIPGGSGGPSTCADFGGAAPDGGQCPAGYSYCQPGGDLNVGPCCLTGASAPWTCYPRTPDDASASEGGDAAGDAQVD